jgi:hypothetical protein
MAPERGRTPRAEDDLLDWFTISYRTIYLAIGLLVLVLLGGGYYYYFVRNASVAPQQPDTPPSTLTTAHFISLEGNVKVRPVGTFEWLTADKSTLLKKSDLVKTGSGAAAEIEFFDGTVVHVRPDSLITIEETSEDPSTKRRKVAWHISSGEVNFATARKNVDGSSTEVSTPTVRAVAGGETKGGIRVADSGESDVRVYRGSGRLETKTGEKIDLKPNEGVKIDAAGKPGVKANLPEVPVLLAPPHQAEITYIDPARATTLLAWKPVEGAMSYHVMLDYSPYFNRPIVDRAGLKDSSVELQGLDVGKYYWRVAAVTKDSSEGAFSDFARFTVNRPAGARGDGPPPPLAIDSAEPRGNILQIKGRTEPGATLTVNGQRVDVQGDGSFNEFITLEKSGRHIITVRAVGINGGVNEKKQSVVVAGF